METLEQLRRRFETLEDLHGIVRTMKALAAVSIRRHEQAVQSLAGYYRTVELGLHVVLREVPLAPPAREEQAHPAAMVVFGSDHGLCGRFNEDISDHARQWASANLAGQRPRVLAVGVRVAALLDAAGTRVDAEMFAPVSAARATPLVHDLLLKIDEWRRAGEVERVYLLHNRPTSQMRHGPSVHRLLPIDLARFRYLRGERWPSPRLPAFSMERERLLAALLRQYLFVALFRSCIQSLAAEQASRLAAMQAAEKSLAERREALLSELSRRRQDAITTELLDVIAGYEALSGGGGGVAGGTGSGGAVQRRRD